MVKLSSGAVQRAEAACFQQTLTLTTERSCHLHDITEPVRSFVGECALQGGVALVHSLHTTAGVLVNEGESGLRADFEELVDRIVPRSKAYRHDDMSIRWENLCPEDAEFPNGHAHLQHALFGCSSAALAIRDGDLVLGCWQRIFLVEYDRPRERSVFMQALGVPALGMEA